MSLQPAERILDVPVTSSRAAKTVESFTPLRPLQPPPLTLPAQSPVIDVAPRINPFVQQLLTSDTLIEDDHGSSPPSSTVFSRMFPSELLARLTACSTIPSRFFRYLRSITPLLDSLILRTPLHTRQDSPPYCSTPRSSTQVLQPSSVPIETSHRTPKSSLSLKLPLFLPARLSKPSRRTPQVHHSTLLLSFPSNPPLHTASALVISFIDDMVHSYSHSYSIFLRIRPPIVPV
jgi:hypothetical protein